MIIENFLNKYYKEDEKVILACSTGPDSMYLLYQILDTSYAKNLIVCYFNHKIRKEADDEEVFLLELSKKFNFVLEIWEANIIKIKELYPSKSLEELAREKRYAFLNAILNIYNTNKIITWHHLDDRIETFFFNLIRWSKITWLINMKEKSWVILRPLLNLEKKEILAYLQKNNLEYKEDVTNFDTQITRNKFRHIILPFFEQINSNYRWNINNFIAYLEEVKDNIDLQVLNFLKNDWFFIIDDFNGLSKLLQKEIIRYIFYKSNWNSTIWLSEANINEVIKFINWKNNKTYKQIKNMLLFKDNKIIKYKNDCT